jgi:hypothetical protein
MQVAAMDLFCDLPAECSASSCSYYAFPSDYSRSPFLQEMHVPRRANMLDLPTSNYWFVHPDNEAASTVYVAMITRLRCSFCTTESA